MASVCVTWLENLKVGDTVSLNDRLNKVSRLTPTQIILESGGRFNRKSGRRVGDSGSWSIACIHEADDAEIARLRHMRLVAKLGNFNWRSLTLETLVAVNAIVAQAEAAPEEKS